MTAEPRAGEVDDADIVDLAGVSVTFPARSSPVLHEVSLRLSPGEQVVVLGPSGAGKSTVLHAISGVVPHTVHAEVTGEVRVAGTLTQDTTVVERSRHLGVLAQDPSAAVCLPVVEQELAMPLENHAVDPATIDSRIDAALEVVGATHLRARSTAGLSGGESQRVALAAALITEPDVLLLDEPTSMLDAEGVAAVRDALDRGLERSGAAVVLVEHRLDEWTGGRGGDALPARALVLDQHGRVVADGPTLTVLGQHARRLHAAGCWLPVDTELRAMTGVDGGLAHPENVALLDGLALGEPEAEDAVGRGEPLLSVRDLAVARPAPRRGRSDPAPPPLLTGIDLDVRGGEVIALLGANGVGKSTVLLTLAGCLPPRSGTVEGPRPGMVFQNAEHQFVASSTRAEIAHGLTGGPEATDRVVERQLQRHRLEHLADQNPFRLSGGEKRRLSLAAMLAHERPVLLADEPTLGLDRRDAIDTSDALRKVAERGGAVVLTSHDLRLVATVATRVVLLGDGGVLADAPTAQALADEDLLGRARLRLPGLVSWLVRRHPAHLRTVLHGLDRAVASSREAAVEGTRRPAVRAAYP